MASKSLGFSNEKPLNSVYELSGLLNGGLIMEDAIYRLKCMHQTMIAVCKDVSANEDPILAHFTMTLGDIIRDMDSKRNNED